MIPLSGTFQKITRLVRDLSVKANKKVDIEIIGDETEVDKTVIEQISDPLVHLIRNSVDHGIESPEERTKKGKTETGKITIEAKHSVGEVWITVTDDGEGLNKEKILNKAIEKGLIAKSSPNLTDDEVWQLIFEPGFSTAEQISNISGRGVGLDVVKRNVEKLGGRVEVYSKSGIETSFVIRIPLTMAIIDGMILKVGNSKYITPIISVKESLRPKPEQITVTPDGLEIVHIREELVPVIRLHELYKIKTDNIKLHEGILVVVESNGKKCCLFGDELLGNQQIVVKALPNYIGHVRSISGCTIMSDGEISMILDIGDLIKSVEG
jgi:two-component system chemotaxis sensor kinase CheA